VHPDAGSCARFSLLLECHTTSALARLCRRRRNATNVLGAVTRLLNPPHHLLRITKSSPARQGALLNPSAVAVVAGGTVLLNLLPEGWKRSAGGPGRAGAGAGLKDDWFWVDLVVCGRARGAEEPVRETDLAAVGLRARPALAVVVGGDKPRPEVPEVGRSKTAGSSRWALVIFVATPFLAFWGLTMNSSSSSSASSADASFDIFLACCGSR